MQCAEATELMSLRLDGHMTPEERAALRGHLGSCENCQAMWQRMQRIHALFDGASLAAPPPLLAQKVMGRVRWRARWQGFWRTSLRLLLGLVVLAMLGVVPLLVISAVAKELAASPVLVPSCVAALVRMVDILATLLRALALIWQAVLVSPNWLILLGFVFLVGGTAAGWLRLVIRPVALPGGINASQV